ncbi:MAG: hypothetical protein ACRDTA_00570, partial [Pseudonocardiaceae bacterium]
QGTVLTWLVGSTGVGVLTGDVVVIHMKVFLGWLTVGCAATGPAHAGSYRGGFPFTPATASPRKPRPAVWERIENFCGGMSSACIHKKETPATLPTR